MAKQVNDENIKQHLIKEVFSNLCKIMQVAVIFSVNSATCETTKKKL